MARLGSPLHQVHPGAPPFLCVHGADDQNVPLSHSETLVAALRAAGVRAELDVVADGGHGFTGADISPIIERSIDFLADVLRADASKT
ncbi:prolyl oligopeptidase family serine peptidase [Microbispora sp. NPDC049633]|uniref:alpha/beta hydrolase family protein n=1 Tax=Microbispora sp. NPDC049633 TaxID=3154355 RepID=UPI003441D2B8